MKEHKSELGLTTRVNGGATLSADHVSIITQVPGYDRQIGHLVSMMGYTRFGTEELVRHLTQDQLEYVHDEQSNSIGSLLMHIAAIETQQQVWSFENRPLNRIELDQWEVALKLGDRARREISGLTLQEYLLCLNKVRQKTLDFFRERADTWLYEQIPAKPTNQYCRWFHVVEDEISHRGQMKWILGRVKARHSNPVPEAAHG